MKENPVTILPVNDIVNTYSLTRHTTSSRAAEEVGEENPVPIAQEPEPSTGKIGTSQLTTMSSEPVPGTSGRGATQYSQSPIPDSPPGSPHYKRLRSTRLPTTTPRKPSRVQVIFPPQTPVRFIGDDGAIYEPTGEETEDSAGYLLPSQRLR